jgi:enediyne biosynthesis protein E4
MTPRIIIGAFLLVVLLGGGAASLWLWLTGIPVPQTGDAEAWFRDVTSEAGLDFMHDAGDLSKFQQPQIHGSGVALFDFDGDGLLDMYFLTHAGPDSPSINRLYRNIGDGRFQDVTAGSGLGIAGYNTGVAIGDVNNDGWPDVLVTRLGGVQLFLNNGNGTFSDGTEESALKNPLWATSASFVDYDRDGWLDLVVVNYLEHDPSAVCYTVSSKREYCGPTQFPGTVSRLFRNLGHTGAGASGRVAFQDVTVAAGLAKAPGPGLAVYCADFNGDGWPDIFIVNDNKPNHLWINQRDGTFTEEAMLRGIGVDAMGQALAGMGVAVGDVDDDGLFDLYVTHLSMERNTLWMQGPRRGDFRDHTARAGLLASQWRGTDFGTLMGDFDQDGWIDIAVVNGAIAQGTPTPNPALKAHLTEYSERNQLFRNEGKGKFRDVSLMNKAFCGTPDVGRGVAQGDLFGSGALDLVVTNVAGRARIYRNVTKGRGHWLQVRAIDPRLKRDAYGAEVRVRAGEKQWLRIINPADSFQCSSDPRAHFGLGPISRIDAIHVVWPDGLAEVFPGGEADQQRLLRRGEGQEP